MFIRSGIALSKRECIRRTSTTSPSSPTQIKTPWSPPGLVSNCHPLFTFPPVFVTISSHFPGNRHATIFRGKTCRQWHSLTFHLLLQVFPPPRGPGPCSLHDLSPLLTENPKINDPGSVAHGLAIQGQVTRRPLSEQRGLWVWPTKMLCLPCRLMSF